MEDSVSGNRNSKWRGSGAGPPPKAPTQLAVRGALEPSGGRRGGVRDTDVWEFAAQLSAFSHERQRARLLKTVDLWTVVAVLTQKRSRKVRKWRIQGVLRSTDRGGRKVKDTDVWEFRGRFERIRDTDVWELREPPAEVKDTDVWELRTDLEKVRDTDVWELREPPAEIRDTDVWEIRSRQPELADGGNPARARKAFVGWRFQARPTPSAGR